MLTALTPPALSHPPKSLMAAAQVKVPSTLLLPRRPPRPRYLEACPQPPLGSPKPSGPTPKATCRMTPKP